MTISPCIFSTQFKPTASSAVATELGHIDGSSSVLANGLGHNSAEGEYAVPPSGAQRPTQIGVSAVARAQAVDCNGHPSQVEPPDQEVAEEL
mmetsp:Transcript_37194/g.99041  ORF Transcript_37194/g.99041 Transcript_37194/m.99041 type:complete len:92 (-) Transcript_37194:89-364(-)